MLMIYQKLLLVNTIDLVETMKLVCFCADWAEILSKKDVGHLTLYYIHFEDCECIYFLLTELIQACLPSRLIISNERK
jgi:hypothetical protein